MDFQRAREIFNSPETIEVFYNGEPVWIDRLFDADKTAQVSSSDLPNGARVQVKDLYEQ